MSKYTHTKNAPANIVAAALTMDLVVADKKAPTEIQLTPVGFFRAKDGRPVDLPDGWYIDADVAKKVIDWNYKNDRVIDYEHQTLLADENGKPAPAAGWFSELQWRESGLWAVNVKWTPAAEKMIIDGEYRFISPVFEYDPKTGHVLDVIMSAVTNNPALDGMAALTNLKHNQFVDEEEELSMKLSLSEIVAALGLPENTTEDEALAALTALKTANTEAEAKVATLTSQVASASTAKVDPAKYVPVEAVADMQKQIAMLTAQSQTDTVATTVDQAITDGRLVPSLKKWGTDLGNSDMAALTAYIDSAAPIVALTKKQVTSSTPPANAGGVVALTAEQAEVAKAMGKAPSEFKAALKLETGE